MENLICNQKVVGSIPTVGTKIKHSGQLKVGLSAF